MLAFNCKEVTTLLATSYLEDQTRWRRLQVRFHLMICYFCRKYERQMAHIAIAFRKHVQMVENSTQTDLFKARLLNTLTNR